MFRRFLRPGWIFVFLVILFLWFRLALGSFSVHETITIEKGDTISTALKPLSSLEKLRVKWHLFQDPDSLWIIQLGSYVFSGDYTPSSFIEVIHAGPKQSFEKITVLEGWSIYDTDAMLAKKGFIQEWEYISTVTDGSFIAKTLEQHPYLTPFVRGESLEWVLYPDTYHINPNQPVLKQVIDLQLKTFYSKVIQAYSGQIESFSQLIRSKGFSFDVSPYSLLILASIVEKEERNIANKPTIAWIFLNRIEKGMRIDADITLCYGLHQWYEYCTPSIIVRSLQDASNLYNTRVHTGLTPTPISTVSAKTIESVLNFEKTDNIYYLHDANGKIWYAVDISWHNNNKSKHL